MPLLLLFLDGVGIGEADPVRNPFLHAQVPTLRALLGGLPVSGNGRLPSPRARLVPTDASLGVGGMPQSGTGQTTIFTGVNAPAVIGKHSGPYPNEALRAVLAEESIFRRLLQQGQRVALANAYPPIFFERLARGTARRTAVMQAALAAGVRMRDLHDLRTGAAVSAFSVTNALWRARGAEVPLITRREAGGILARVARAHDFTAFEYSLADIAGHKDDRTRIVNVIEEIDALLGGAVEEMDPRMTLLVTSDHGNVEDWTVRGHTLNPALTLVRGPGQDQLAAEIHSLADITPAVVRFLDKSTGKQAEGGARSND